MLQTYTISERGRHASNDSLRHMDETSEVVARGAQAQQCAGQGKLFQMKGGKGATSFARTF